MSRTALLAFLRRQQRLLVLTGAGISTDSGIPDYRDANGAWKRQQPVQYQDFLNSPYARQRYWARGMVGWQHFQSARPNTTHQALVHLEQLGHIHQLITQNVDGLHQQAGQRRVIDLHGRLDSVICLDCKQRFPRETVQRALETLNPDFHPAHPAAAAPDGDAQLEQDFSDFQVPSCWQCGGLLKPWVVFFGETIPKPRSELSLRRLEEADGLLVVGSSLTVFSGYRFVREARRQNKPVAILNLGKTRADDEVSLKVTAPCGEVLPALVEALASAPTLG